MKYRIRAVVASCAILIPAAAPAQTICDHIKAVMDDTPDFTHVRGAASGTGYVGTVTFPQAHCVVIPQTDGGKPIAGKWLYECTWPNRYPESVSWMKDTIQACYAGATFSEASTLGVTDEPGGVFSYGNVFIMFLFNPKTGKLTLQIENPYR